MWPHLFPLYASQIYKTILANGIVWVTTIVLCCFPCVTLFVVVFTGNSITITWPDSRFLFWLCNFNKSVRLQIVFVSQKNKTKQNKNKKTERKQAKSLPKWNFLAKIDNQTFNLFVKWISSTFKHSVYQFFFFFFWWASSSNCEGGPFGSVSYLSFGRSQDALVSGPSVTMDRYPLSHWTRGGEGGWGIDQPLLL